MPASVRVAVAGATGYIGMQCVSLLAQHPHVSLARLIGRSNVGARHCDVAPGSEVVLPIEGDLDSDSVDAVFAALPHTVAAQHAATWLRNGAVVVDLSADFRLRDAAQYRAWYATNHAAPDLCEEAVYGLVEAHRDELRAADLIAVPGCYPTAALIACLPPLRAGLVSGEIVVDAKSGVSGAGRSPQLSTHFGEVNESVSAYAVQGHRHTPEMLEQLRAAAGGEVRLTFVPHLVPMTRGILLTAYLRPLPGVSVDPLIAAYTEFAERSPSIRVCATPPSTKQVSGSNRALVNVTLQGNVAVVTVVIDNLMKGAAGQAVQAFNVRFGFDEGAGLERLPLWP